MSVITPAAELANIEIRRLSSIAWISISLFYSLLALLAQIPFSKWQIYYISGVIVTLAVSMILQNYLAFDYSFLPLISYLLISPIILGTEPAKPWMSFGLLTLTTNLYFATIFRRNFAILAMAMVTIFQIWVIKKDLSSISDLSDMQLLNTYFSTLWTFGTGIAFMVIRNRYVDASIEIEEEIIQLKERISSRFQAISMRNRNDYRNLKLHGTILNTLIFAKNNPEFLTDRENLVASIKTELSDLQSNEESFQPDLRGTLESLLNKRTLKGIRVSRLEVSGRIGEASLENNILEIIREILLNLEKHTTVAEVQIELHISIDRDILLRISESAHYEVSSKNLEVRKADALRSESLKRLLSIAPSQLTISSTPDGFGLIYTVTNLEAPERSGDPREIYRLRNVNLIDFAANLGRATAIFGLLFLPGYLFLGIEKDILILLTLHSAIVGYSVINKTTSKTWLSFSSFFSLALPVIISQSVQDCFEISYLPWLLNIILMTAFIFATEIPNKFLRWVPIAIISVELLLLPQSYPAGCQDIFLGSTPAIPLIIAFALVLGSLRKRLYKQDADQISSAFVDESNVRKYEDALESEYRDIIGELEDFNEILPTLPESALSVRIENEIQKIRAFLVCSEQFESEILRELYRFVIGRLRNGVATRLNILGEFIYQLDQSISIGDFLTKLSRELDEIPCEITVVKLQVLTFEINVEDKFIDQIKPISEENIAVRIIPTSN